MLLGTDDRIIIIPNHLGALLRAHLPDLNLAAPADDADPVLGQQVARRVGVVVDAAVEHGGGVLADGGRDEPLAARVLAGEIGHVVHETRDGDQGAGARLLDKVVPLHQGQHGQGLAPVEDAELAVELLLLLLQLALVDLVLGEGAQVAGQAEELPGGDAPLVGVVGQPSRRVAVVGRKLLLGRLVGWRGTQSADANG